ncbi:chalcone-flavanone isomerase family protein [Artemisia annua]|uniref:Chalcone-flavanone isomerase family protein n=1 Tax=Artemisia annua TaxID=35608 RepID=A0A2U1LN54_ARTAN|nr:chalcone-flavanone isomerase family protein [Artemisia annua]
MVSFRFPFSIPPLPTGIISPATIACSVALTAGISAGISISQNSTSVQNTLNSFVYKKPCFGSLSLSEGDVAVKEEKSGVVFPGVVDGNKGLLGVGLRRKVLFGLKNIDVYAFGVYADESDIKNFLNEKYATLSTTELKNANISQDLMESDVSVTVRLQIVYGKLSIRSVRNAFEDSVGTRLKKFGGSDNKELLHKFTSQFSDEYKIPRGSIINLSKEKGYVLRTTIDGKEVGSVQSQLLCRSILDLYIGDEPFDSKAKEDIDNKLVSAITE